MFTTLTRVMDDHFHTLPATAVLSVVNCICSLYHCSAPYRRHGSITATGSCLLLQGLKAIHSPHTGIADYGLVANKLIHLFKQDRGSTYTNFEVSGFSEASSSEAGDAPVRIHAKNKVREKQLSCEFSGVSSLNIIYTNQLTAGILCQQNCSPFIRSSLLPPHSFYSSLRLFLSQFLSLPMIYCFQTSSRT